MKLINNIGIYFLIAACLFLGGAWLAWGIAQDEIARNNQNFRSQIEGLKHGVDSSVSRVTEKVLTKEEFTTYFTGLENKVTDIGLKVKNIKMASYTATEHTQTFETHVRDTLIGDTIKAQVADYSDQWTEFHWMKPESENEANVSFSTSDSIFVFYGRPNWKFKNLFQKREYSWYLKNANPHNKIIDSQFIKIK